jgi:hypothetical protein
MMKFISQKCDDISGRCVTLFQEAISSTSPITFSFVIFWRKNIGEKGVRKMLMKLTLGLNFINILRTAFMLVDPKSKKRC